MEWKTSYIKLKDQSIPVLLGQYHVCWWPVSCYQVLSSIDCERNDMRILLPSLIMNLIKLFQKFVDKFHEMKIPIYA